jgi:hypothetical protein
MGIKGEITIKLLESDIDIAGKLLKGLASKANERLTYTIRKSRVQIVDYLYRIILNTPEMVELQGGILQAEFGLTAGKASAAVQDIAKRVSESVTVKSKRVVVDGSTGIKGGITILIQPVDFSNVTASPQSIVRTEKGKQLDWLEWLLFKGDAIIIDSYEFRAKKGKGRSGMGTMSETKGGIWRVPPQYSGTGDDNFITKALQSDTNVNNIAKILFKNMMKS